MSRINAIFGYVYFTGIVCACTVFAGETVLLSDNFNSADNTDVSAGIATAGRQSGSFAPAGYDEVGAAGVHSIASSQLAATPGGTLASQVDLADALWYADGFRMEFDAALTDGAGWLSPYLSTHPGDERGQSRIGLLIFANGQVTAYKENAGSSGTQNISSNGLATALGAWRVDATNHYSLVASCTTATSGTYRVSVNGVEVLSNLPYTLGSGGSNGEVNWENINSTASGVFDNLAISVTRTDTLLFADSFNSADNTDVDADMSDPGRQAGSFAPAGYDEGAEYSIASSQLAAMAGGGLASQVDLADALTYANGFRMEFDAALTDGTGWLSPYLSTHSGDERGQSRIGLLIFADGQVTAYKENAGSPGTQNISSNGLATALGLWRVDATNHYSLVASCTTATSGTYDVFINGVEVLSDNSYVFGGGGDNGEINWENYSHVADGVFDNLVISTWRIGSTDTLLFADSFDSADNTDVDADMSDPGRQAGSLATAGYTEGGDAGVHEIVDHQLDVAGGGAIETMTDFEPYLTAPRVSGFTVSFDAALTSGTAWLSPYLSTHSGDERGESRCGLLIFANGQVKAYKENAGSQGTQIISSNDLATALGSWSQHATNSYELVGTATTPTSGTYDVFINGVEVLSDNSYVFGGGGSNGEVNWENVNHLATGVFDNLAISVRWHPRGTVFLFR